MTDTISVVVALGSNLGDSTEVIRDAFVALEALADSPVQCSSLWASEPVDCPPDSPDFVNAVAVFEVSEGTNPEGLLRSLKELEADFGRRPKKVHNEPRPLDLDLICFGDVAMQSAELTLPHPRAHLRSFVILPLNELCPELDFRGAGKRVRDLAAELGGDPGIRKI